MLIFSKLEGKGTEKLNSEKPLTVLVSKVTVRRQTKNVIAQGLFPQETTLTVGGLKTAGYLVNFWFDME